MSFDNPFQYAGWENDGTGLYYYRARYYSTELQRFVSEDPIRFKGGINFYRYVGNIPTTFRDPLGLEPVPCDDCARMDQQEKGTCDVPKLGLYALPRACGQAVLTCQNNCNRKHRGR